VPAYRRCRYRQLMAVESDLKWRAAEVDLTTPGIVTVSVPSVRAGTPSAALSGHRVKLAELHMRERVPDSSFTRNDVVISMDGGLMPMVGNNGGLPLLPPGTEVPVRPAQPNAAHIPLPVRTCPHRCGRRAVESSTAS
jgi:hypothetical protein